MVSIISFHTYTFGVSWASHFHRNTDIYQELKDPAKEIAEGNGFWGSISELHTPRGSGVKHNGMEGTQNVG